MCSAEQKGRNYQVKDNIRNRETKREKEKERFIVRGGGLVLFIIITEQRCIHPSFDSPHYLIPPPVFLPPCHYFFVGGKGNDESIVFFVDVFFSVLIDLAKSHVS